MGVYRKFDPSLHYRNTPAKTWPLDHVNGSHEKKSHGSLKTHYASASDSHTFCGAARMDGKHTLPGSVTKDRIVKTDATCKTCRDRARMGIAIVKYIPQITASFKKVKCDTPGCVSMTYSNGTVYYCVICDNEMFQRCLKCVCGELVGWHKCAGDQDLSVSHSR